VRHSENEYRVVDSEHETVGMFRLKDRKYDAKRYCLKDTISSSLIQDLRIEGKETF
jgi:hypothetical protein